MLYNLFATPGSLPSRPWSPKIALQLDRRRRETPEHKKVTTWLALFAIFGPWTLPVQAPEPDGGARREHGRDEHHARPAPPPPTPPPLDRLEDAKLHRRRA